MPLPQIFATVPANTRVAGAQLDRDLDQVGTMGIMPCTATGTNAIALTPFANLPDIPAYANYLRFGFVAANTSTGSVTVNFNSLGALPWYRGDGTTQLGTGEVIAGEYYDLAFNQALNSGSGGFIGAGASFGGAVGPTGPAIGPTGPTGPGNTGPTGPTGPAGTGAIAVIRVQRFTASATYTPDAHLLYATIELVGGGGGGGGIVGAGANVVQAGGGGGAGAYNRKTASAATIGVSQAVTVGNPGAAGDGTTPADGGTGGTSSVGAIVSAGGGAGGVTASGGGGGANSAAGGLGGTNSGGDFNAVGAMPGAIGYGNNPTNVVLMTVGGQGGSGPWGGGGRQTVHFTGTSGAGDTAQLYGAGGSGASGTGDATAQNGGAGSKGLVVITEFCSQ